jgi:hypothetical protein
MSPRRPPKRPTTARPIREVRAEEFAGGEYVVRPMSGAATTKSYRCPGCDHEIVPGTPHVVVWPADHPGGAEDRRHWHSPCWRARDRRRPNR